MSEQKKSYVDAISELIERCNDISLLDLLYKLLCAEGGCNA